MSMTPTDEDLQQMLLAEVRQTETSPFAEYLPTIWALYAPQGYTSKALQYVLAKKRAIDWLLFGTYGYRDVSQQGVSDARSQIFEHLLDLKKEINDEIAQVRADLRNGRTAQIALITKQAPITDPNGIRDPNDDVYKGNPLKPWLPRRF